MGSVTKNEKENKETISMKNQSSSSVSDSRKSCLKSQSTQSLKSRSQSPSVVKFSPKLTNRSSDWKKPEITTEQNPPFEWIEFRRADGEIVKGTVLPALVKDEKIDIPIEIAEADSEVEKEKVYEDVQPRDGTKLSCDAETQTEKYDKKSSCAI